MTASQSPTGRSVFDRWGRRGTAIVLGLSAVVLLLIGATAGMALSSNTASAPAAGATSAAPGADSVDVGFMRDMIVHHEQGVLLAHIAQGNGGGAAVAGQAYDIEYQQTAQIGQMTGFLTLWDYSLNNLNAPMAWMTGSDASMGAMTTDAAAVADGALMPGMATNDEIAKLKTLRGQQSDAYFLQLMIRHHQGGIPMMNYAAAHAVNPVVKNMATKMTEAQGLEVTSMTTLLATFNAVPLPFPSTSGSASSTTTSNGPAPTVSGATESGVMPSMSTSPSTP